MKKLLDAIDYSARMHRGQNRKGGDGKTAYINHPIDVANILASHNIEDENILISAICHDIIEDTECLYEHILVRYNKIVADIVLECTDNCMLLKPIRKKEQINNAPNLKIESKYIRIADKISNIKSLDKTPPKWGKDRIKGYLIWSKAVVDATRLKEHSLSLEFYHYYNIISTHYNFEFENIDKELENYYNIIA